MQFDMSQFDNLELDNIGQWPKAARPDHGRPSTRAGPARRAAARGPRGGRALPLPPRGGQPSRRAGCIGGASCHGGR